MLRTHRGELYHGIWWHVQVNALLRQRTFQRPKTFTSHSFSACFCARLCTHALFPISGTFGLVRRWAGSRGELLIAYGPKVGSIIMAMLSFITTHHGSVLPLWCFPFTVTVVSLSSLCLSTRASQPTSRIMMWRGLATIAVATVAATSHAGELQSCCCHASDENDSRHVRPLSLCSFD